MMHTAPLLTIIIPVFNVEKYLRKCVDSVLDQTCASLEIILVDDGSSDGCPAICDAYQLQLPDIVKVIHQDNLGASAARNAGIAAASGKWLCFVDSDDWVEPNMAGIMLSIAEKDDADIHFFGFFRDYVDYSMPRSLPDMLLPDAVTRNFLHQCQVELVSHTGACSKLFRSSLILDNELCFFPDLPGGEDEIFVLYAMHHAKRVMLHSDCLYHYRMVASSTTNKWDEEKMRRIELSHERYSVRYQEFVDRNFGGEEGLLMKQTKAVQQLMTLARAYGNPNAKLARREKIGILRGHIAQEPMKSAVKSLPLRLLPGRRRWQVWLLRLGFVGLWFDLFRAADRMWMKKKVGRGHEMFQ